MSRKTIIIFSIVILLGISGYFVFTNMQNGQNTAPNNTSSGGGFSSLFPFFNRNTNTGTDQEQTGSTNTGGDSTQTPNQDNGPLHRITDKSVAGYTFIEKNITTKTSSPDGKETTETTKVSMIRFIERGTGNIYDIDLEGNNEQKISGTPILRTAIGQFGNAGKTVIIRYIKNDNKTVATYLGQIIEPSIDENLNEIPGKINGVFLPDNIIDIAISPDEKNFAYIVPTDTEVVGFSRKMDGSGNKQIFDSAFSEWLMQWSSSGIIATTKAASDVAGYMYKVSSTGTFMRLFGGIQGFTTLVSPNTKNILFSTGSERTLSLHIHHLSDGTDTDPGLQTLPEKCVWSSKNILVYCAVPNRLPDVLYPDGWYQGIAEFSDNVWKIDTETGQTTKITNAETNIDGTYLHLDSNESHLYFVDKKNGSLWSLDLES